MFILLTAFCYPFRLMRSTESRFKDAVFVLAAIVVLAVKTSYLRQVFKGGANDSFYDFGHEQLGIFVIF